MGQQQLKSLCLGGLLTIGAAALAALPASAQTSGNAAQGRAAFQAHCAMCHTTKAGTNGIGPSLAGVVGRKAGTAPGYRYSTAMVNSGITWNDQALRGYLPQPKAVVPGTKMSFRGVSNQQTVNDLIAYLNSLK